MVALAVFGAVCTIGFSYYLASFIAEVFTTRYVGINVESLYWVALFGLAKAGILWLQELLSVRSSLAAKLELRRKLLTAISHLGGRWVSARSSSDLTLLATHRIDALDAYFARFLPSLVGTALVTPLMTLVIFRQDFWSGVAVVCTIPLIPLFMIVIGWATQDVQQRQLDSLRILSKHFTEVLRGLTTLRVFGRLPHQPAAIAASSEDFRKRTMKVLRMSFLSGMALEVAASLSVALVAVSIGLRLIDGSLLLGPGLFALLLAPEAYLPLRQVGANFHASNEGVLASKEILDVIDEGARVGSFATHSPTNLASFEPGRVTQLTGPSGAGKTSYLTGLRASLPVGEVAWMPQGAKLFAGSLRENIVGPGVTDFDETALNKALKLACVDDVDLDRSASDASTNLSGGQAQRVALARAFYRALTKPVTWLLLDEPLSALDAVRASRVEDGIAEFKLLGMRVVLVSHQSVGIADHSLAVTDA